MRYETYVEIVSSYPWILTWDLSTIKITLLTEQWDGWRDIFSLRNGFENWIVQEILKIWTKIVSELLYTGRYLFQASYENYHFNLSKCKRVTLKRTPPFVRRSNRKCLCRVNLEICKTRHYTPWTAIHIFFKPLFVAQLVL